MDQKLHVSVIMFSIGCNRIAFVHWVFSRTHYSVGPFQVIEAIGGILGEAESALQKEVVDARSQRDSAVAEKACTIGKGLSAAGAEEPV